MIIDFSEFISFPIIEPLDNLYLFKSMYNLYPPFSKRLISQFNFLYILLWVAGGQVVEFVDELVDLVFKRFYLGLFFRGVEVIGRAPVSKFLPAILRQPFRQLLRQQLCRTWISTGSLCLFCLVNWPMCAGI